MFNLQSLVAMASQAMLKKLISSDSMYSQWNTFCKKWGLPQTSRAEFDNLVSQFNSTPADQKILPCNALCRIIRKPSSLI